MAKYEVGSSKSGAPPSAPAAKKALSGSAGLVQDLSNKLAKQRKQLEELVAQNAAKKSTWRWYHVFLLICVNNMFVVGIGISVASVYYGIGPLDGGSFKAGAIKAEGLTVLNEEGPQDVLFESTTGSAQLSIQAATGHKAKLVFAGAGAEEVERFSMESEGTESFAITQAGQKRLSIEAEGNRTNININPYHGELVINDDLSFGQDTIRTRNSSLTLQAGMNHDIILDPSGDGSVKVESGLDIDGKLTVGDETNPLMVVDPAASAVDIGTAARPARMNVHGTTVLSDTLTILEGGLEIVNGDVLLGNADVSTDGDLQVSGNVNLGDSPEDLITIRGVMTIVDEQNDPVVEINPVTGDIILQGSLTVEGDAELRGDVILGSKPTDTVTINADKTQMKSLIATGDVMLGDNDDDTVTIYGALHIKNNNDDIVFSIDSFTGDTVTDGSLTVTGQSQFDGSVTLGDSPLDQITLYGSAVLRGDVTMHDRLTVEGPTVMADVYAENVTLSGMLRIRDEDEQVKFSIDPKSGDMFSAGSLWVAGNANFDADVTLGSSPADLIKFNGPVIVQSNLEVQEDVVVQGNAQVDGLAQVLGDVTVAGDLQVDGDVYLGAGPQDEIVLSGHLLVQDGPYPVFTVNPDSGNVVTEGSLTVEGEAFFEDAVTVSAPMEIMGKTLVRAGLEVLGETTIGGDVTVGGDMNVNGELLVQDRLAVAGDVVLGSTDQNEVTVRGELQVKNADNDVVFRVDPSTGNTEVVGTLRVDGPAVFAASVTLGDAPADLVTVHGITTFESDLNAEEEMTVQDLLTVHGDTVMESNLVVTGSVQLGDDVSDTITINGDLQVTNALGETKFEVSAATGNVVTQGSMEVHGNLNVEGQITTPEFVVEQLLVDRVNEKVEGEGVTVEGVLFKDGGIDWTKAHEINELVDGAGVTIEGVNFKDGTVVMTGKRAGPSPKGEIDLLTLVNSAHASSMTDVMTTIKFRQYYHATDGQHQPADSGAISVGTTNDWTEDSTTHNAYMTFQTANQGDVSERLRITAEGDFKLNTDKVVFRAQTGNAEIAGNVYVGGGADPRYLTVSSQTAEAAIRIISGGDEDATLSLKSPFGETCTSAYGIYCATLVMAGIDPAADQTTCTTELIIGSSNPKCTYTATNGVNPATCTDSTVDPSTGAGLTCTNVVSTFEIKNEGMPPYNAIVGQRAPVLRFTDGTDNLMSLTDLGNTGNLHVSGNVVVGSAQSPGLHSLVVQSGAAAELLVQSGEDADAAVTITSGIDQNARLVLVDPALDGQGSTFEIFNDGAENEFPSLKIADGDTNVMLEIVDMGTTGDLHVTGDGIIGTTASTGDRRLTVKSNATADIEIKAGGNSDAILSITSGRDQNAKLMLVDPAGAAVCYPNNVALCAAEVVAAACNGVANCKWADNECAPDRAIVSLCSAQSSNGNGPCLAVQSGGLGVCSFQDADPTAEGSEFHIFNDGPAGLDAGHPIMRITDGDFTMLTLADKGETGDLAVTGSGLFGGPEAIGERTLSVQSSAEAKVEVNAGGSSDASVIVTSGANQKAKLVFMDPDEENGNSFEVYNDGAASQPTLRVTDGGDTPNDMLKIIDKGTSGDLFVSGNGLFGGPDTIGSRTLKVQSSLAADMQVISGSGHDASVVVQAGAENDAKIVLVDPASGFDGSSFEIMNDGSEVRPTLRITDGTHTMLTLTDTGTTGDLAVTGSGMFGGVDVAEDRVLSIQSGKESRLEVVAGTGYEATVTIKAGIDKDAKLILSDGDPNAAAGSHFEIVNEGTENEYPALAITDGTYTMLRIVDEGASGTMLVTGDGTFGGTNSMGARTVTVQSSEQAAVEVLSGESSDATVTISAGVDMDAKLVLEDSASGGAKFEMLNDGSPDNEFPMFKITDGTNMMMSIVDKGPVGDLLVSGSATFGGEGAMGDREVTVQSTGVASVNVISGPGNDAVVTITAGENQDARLILEDPSDGGATAGSVFEIYNDGSESDPTLRFTDGSQTDANGNIIGDGNTLMALVDKGDTAELQVTGDGVFGSYTAVGDRTLTVQSGGAASVSVQSGGANDASVTVTAGSNQDARVQFIDPATGAGEGAVFQIVNQGGAADPTLKITDGDDNSLVTITDNGVTGDMTVAGTVNCVNFESTGQVQLGTGLEDQIIINGHIKQSELVFDANSDGNSLTLHFEDPTESRTITFPDETGTVLTNTSAFSTLTAVGALSAGSIVPGFGSITTANNIETVGSGTITSGGAFTALGDFIANGDVYLGDDATDQIVVRGTVVSDITFAPNKGLSFENTDGDKSTTITAAFNPTTVDSPPGERVVTIPDVPTGGTLHVVTKGVGQVSNTFQINMDVTAGVIENYDPSLGAGVEESLFLDNDLIKATSIVVATIADFGSGGHIFVFSVKVNAGGGGCTFIMRNIHPTIPMQSTYKVAFAVFN
eukprot:COSAG05_NODE_233_length_13251_cov_30.223920_1_plen_2428_part_00